MTNSRQILFKSSLILLLSAILFSSCVSTKRIRYLQDLSDAQTERSEFKNDSVPVYRIHPGDDLYVKVNSLDEKSNYFENSANYNNYYTESAIYLNSYSVNDSGYIEFPLIGKVEVINKTVDEVREILQGRVNEYVKNTVVIVKLANFRITMIGEFKMPGKYLVYQDKINIFEAIAMAGDMTDFAKRDRVMLIRQTEKGSRTYRLNLIDNKMLESDLFYLKPNDLVYVEPVNAKPFAFSEFPYVLIFSTITTTLLLIEYFTK